MKGVEPKKMAVLWYKAIAECLESVGVSSCDSCIDERFFQHWCWVMEEICSAASSRDSWIAATKQQRIAAFENKFFSFENFKKEIFETCLRRQATGAGH